MGIMIISNDYSCSFAFIDILDLLEYTESNNKKMR